MRPSPRFLVWLACLSACLATAPASARPVGCPASSSAHTGFIITLSNEEAFQVDRIVGDITYLRHLDNRLNTISTEELYRGLFTLVSDGPRGRSIFTYDVDPAALFPLQGAHIYAVGGSMIDSQGRSSRVERTIEIVDGGTRQMEQFHNVYGLCFYNVKRILAATVWPSLGLEFRQEKLWSESLRAVLYLRTEVYQNGVLTRVTEYDGKYIDFLD
jgi:hypothetical protein